MLFNSVEFAIFLPVVFILYWFPLGRRAQLQNALILAASYFFYGWWEWRLLSLVVFSSAVDFYVGLRLEQTQLAAQRKALLLLSLSANLGVLGFFKYFDFFADSLVAACAAIGIVLSKPSLDLILPIGISFYTFQTLSYTIDVYHRRITAIRNPVEFFAFVSFFPQLVAGPIERARNLLPQFQHERHFSAADARDGLRQILGGLVKKVVVADTCATQADLIFGSPHGLSGGVLWLGVLLFAFQIYCDFSGYSDIAIGTARLFGFQLTRNFALPYFSRDIGEFWRRWHISLSSWFRDYVFIPLGGSRVSPLRRMLNILVTFTVSGLWHGANFTFVVWGLLHGLYYSLSMLFGATAHHDRIVASDRPLPRLEDLLRIAATFVVVLIAWVFFRAATIRDAFVYLTGMFTSASFAGFSTYAAPLAFVVPLVILEWVQRRREHMLQLDRAPELLRWAAYYVLIFLVIRHWGDERPFVYFQF